ncbi:MAG: HAMP domain-containing histidine kinase [Clostridia bacterium]|nr:HAMP domain-containing histidine kinase [Clostridia bacterium]
MKTKFENVKADEQTKSRPKKKVGGLSRRELKRLVRFETKPSFQGLLIGSFVSFTLIIFLAIILIFILFNWLNRYEQIDLSTAKLPDFTEYLREEEYSRIPTVSIFGVDGWFEVVEADGTSLYSSTGASRHYTREELELIKKFGSTETITTQTLADDNGVKTYVVTRSYEESGKQHNLYLILDGNFNRISGDIGYGKTSFSKEEFEVLSYQSEHSGQVFAKYFFVASNGKPRYVVFLDTNDNVEFQFEYLIGIAIIIALIIYGIVMAVYINYINRNLQQPLATISLAMRKFAKGEDRSPLEYKGRLEFEQLANSFNEMVNLLNASEQEKQEIEKRRQDMLAGLSHDLKTPITIIQGFSKAIRDGVVAESEKQKYLDLIVAKSEQMGSLINSFYEFSKLDHPDFVYNMQRTDVAELIRSHIAELYNEFTLRKYNLDADITEEQLFASIDSAMTVRVIDNIVSNFFKYTPVGSTLFVDVKRNGNTCLIKFADNGGGIPKSARADIFEPFVVGEKSRNKQGSGLGLAVCHKIITSMGGTITLSDNPIAGYSTEFDITLPLMDVDNSI